MLAAQSCLWKNSAKGNVFESHDSDRLPGYNHIQILLQLTYSRLKSKMLISSYLSLNKTIKVCW